MKTVINKTRKPLRIRLPGGKTLFLGATRRGQVRDEALEHPPVKRLLETGDIEVSDDSRPSHGSSESGALPGSGSGESHVGGRANQTGGDR